MQNEILKPVLDTDEVAVPRYDIVSPNGSVIQQNVELRLKNEVVQEGTPYDEESVLPASLREQLELPQSATPAEAMAALLTKSGGAVRRNRPPLTTDAEQVGKLWVVPEMFFNNLMPNAMTQVAGNWQSSNAAVTVSGNTATFTGNGTENSVYVQAGMLASAKAGDKIFVQATVKVNHDANAATVQLTCGEQTLVTKTLDVPAAGATMLLQAVATVENGGALVLRVHSVYNTAAVQSGKSLTVSAITVWNLTEDMCEAQEGNEFTEAEAANYISSFGQFQSKQYEWGRLWWICEGVHQDQYIWSRPTERVETLEAQNVQQAEALSRTQYDLMMLWLKDYYLNGAAWAPQAVGAKAVLFDGLLDSTYLAEYTCKYAAQLLTFPNKADATNMWFAGTTASKGSKQTNDSTVSVSGKALSWTQGPQGSYKLAGMRVTAPAGLTFTKITFSGRSGGFSRTRMRYYYTSTDGTNFTLQESGTSFLDTEKAGYWSFSRALSGVKAVEFWVDGANQSGSGTNASSFSVTVEYSGTIEFIATSVDFSLPESYRRAKLFLAANSLTGLNVSADLGRNAKAELVSQRADPLSSGFVEYEFNIEAETAGNTFTLYLRSAANLSSSLKVKRYGVYFTE